MASVVLRLEWEMALHITQIIRCSGKDWNPGSDSLHAGRYDVEAVMELIGRTDRVNFTARCLKWKLPSVKNTEHPSCKSCRDKYLGSIKRGL